MPPAEPTPTAVHVAPRSGRPTSVCGVMIPAEGRTLDAGDVDLGTLQRIEASPAVIATPVPAPPKPRKPKSE